MFKKKCPNCGAENNKERMTCIECGSPLSSGQAKGQIPRAAIRHEVGEKDDTVSEKREAQIQKEHVAVGKARQDRHRKIRRRLYFLIPFGVLWVAIGLSIIVSSATSNAGAFFTIFAVAIFLFGFISVFRRIRRIQLDLKEQPAEIEGILTDKRRASHSSGQGGTTHTYHLRIDTLGFELECGKNEWDSVGEGDKVRTIYHQHSKYIESITLTAKGTGEETTVYQRAWERANGRCQCLKEHHGHDMPCNKELKQDAYMQKVEEGWVYCDLYDFSSKDIDVPGIVCWECYNWRIDFNLDRLQSRPMT